MEGTQTCGLEDYQEVLEGWWFRVISDQYESEYCPRDLDGLEKLHTKKIAKKKKDPNLLTPNPTKVSSNYNACLLYLDLFPPFWILKCIVWT